MAHRAALIALLVAIATGWVAYDQAETAVGLIALSVALSACLTFAILMVVSLTAEAEEDVARETAAAPWMDIPPGWNGSGSPRLLDARPTGKGVRRGSSPDKEGAARC